MISTCTSVAAASGGSSREQMCPSPAAAKDTPATTPSQFHQCPACPSSIHVPVKTAATHPVSSTSLHMRAAPRLTPLAPPRTSRRNSSARPPNTPMEDMPEAVPTETEMKNMSCSAGQ